MIDCHVHILPGLDDGARDTRACYDMCLRACEDGIRHVIATPHHGNGLYAAAPELVRTRVETLNAFLDRQGLDLTIHAGCEAHLTPRLLESVEAGQILTLAGSRYLLLELPAQELPMGLEQFIFHCIVRNIQPVIAHPERIGAVQRDPDVLAPLVRSGALVQLTAQSLLGDFGQPARCCAEQLLQRQLAHILASDAHGPTRRPPALAAAVQAAGEILESEAAALRMVTDIPAMLLANEPYEPPAPLDPLPPPRRGFWAMVRDFM